jgi:uridine kinase
MLIGMDVPIRELLELVHQKKLEVNDIVISIVGCPGVGKTTLAKALYDQVLEREMFTLICVSASECSSAEDLVKKVIQQASNVHPAKMREATSTTNDMDLMKNILAQKRYSLHPPCVKFSL